MYKETWCIPDLVAKLEPYDFLLCDYFNCLIVDGFESRECVEVRAGDDVGVDNVAYLGRGFKQAML